MLKKLTPIKFLLTYLTFMHEKIKKNKVKLTLHKIICVCLCITEIEYYQHRIFIKIITAYNVNIVHTYKCACVCAYVLHKYYWNNLLHL